MKSKIPALTMIILSFFLAVTPNVSALAIDDGHIQYTNGQAYDYSAVLYPQQRKVFYSQGHFFALYSDGANHFVASSKDGNSWSKGRVGAPNEYGYRTSVWQTEEGKIFHVIGAHRFVAYSVWTVDRSGVIEQKMFSQYEEGRGEVHFAIYFLRDYAFSVDGTPDNPYTSHDPPSAESWGIYPTITFDTAGTAWIAYKLQDEYQGSSRLYVMALSNENDILTIKPGYPIIIEDSAYSSQYHNIVLPLPDGTVYLLYDSFDGSEYTVNGAVLSIGNIAKEGVIAKTPYYADFSAVVFKGKVCLAYQGQYGSLYFSQRESSGYWTETEISSNGDYPVLSQNGEKAQILYTWNNSIYLSEGPSFSAPELVVSNSGRIRPYLSSIYDSSNGAAFIYMVGDRAPFEIRGAAIGLEGSTTPEIDLDLNMILAALIVVVTILIVLKWGKKK